MRITVVSTPACHFCDEADASLAALAAAFAFAVERVAADSPEGRRLVTQHRPALAPLVLVDGAYFSAGRLPRKKLARLLGERAEPAAATGPEQIVSAATAPGPAVPVGAAPTEAARG